MGVIHSTVSIDGNRSIGRTTDNGDAGEILAAKQHRGTDARKEGRDRDVTKILTVREC